MSSEFIIDQINLSLTKAYELAIKGNKVSSLQLIKNILRYLHLLDMRNKLDIISKIIGLISELEAFDFYEKELLEEIKSISKSVPNDPKIINNLARIKVRLAMMLANKGEYPDKELKDALELYLKLIKNKEYITDLLSFLATIYSEICKKFGMYVEAKSTILKILDEINHINLAEISKNIAPYVSEVLTALSEIEYLNNEIKDSIKHLIQATNIYLEIGYFEEAVNLSKITADLLAEFISKEKALEFLKDVRNKILDNKLLDEIDLKIREISS